MFKDRVFVKNLAATAITGSDAWNRPTAQPISISISLDTDFSKASETDNLKYSLNYAVISRHVAEFMKANEHRNFKSLQNIGEEVSKVVLHEKKGGGHQGEIAVRSAKSEIRADWIEYRMHRNRDGATEVLDTINVKRLRLITIIGVFTFERLKKQIVDIDLSIELLQHHNVQIHEIMDEVTSFVECSNFKTVEALEAKVGQLILQSHGSHINALRVTITKPNAITYTDGVGVSSRLTKETFKDHKAIDIQAAQPQNGGFNLPVSEQESQVDADADHIAYLAFGSNEGDQVSNIVKASRLLEKNDIRIVATSSMYISKPMYFKDQSDFFNGVFKVAFRGKSPHDLLKIIKDIEYNEIKRVKEFDNGPRSIDLDILLYDDVIMNDPALAIPHKSMLDRTFVLQPLCELVPPDYIHPVSTEPLHNHLRELLKSSANESLQDSNQLLQYVPVPRLTPEENPLRFDQTAHQTKTLMMGILNITPDSFSDGGNNFKTPIDDVLDTVGSMISHGASIIDIGGVSTRPGSEAPTEKEELSRVIPIIEAIRSSKHSHVLISVDTYRSGVAEQSLLKGADIINDISMGLYDEKMFSVIAKYNCPYVFNHTRGTPKTMGTLTKYEANVNEDIIEIISDPLTSSSASIGENPETDNVIKGICREQSLQLLKAFDAGVRKWQIILDPGIGFAKGLEQNLIVLQKMSYMKKYCMVLHQRHDSTNKVTEHYISFNGLPVLAGASRKKFLGALANEPEPHQRVVATCASVMACIQQHGDIVRVHDTLEVGKTIVVGDAIYKNQ